MVRLAVIFLVIALAAALCGFGFVSGLAFDAAKLLFFVFIVLAILSLIGGKWNTP